jgi:hypothetical protein
MRIIFDTIYTFEMEGEMPSNRYLCKIGADFHTLPVGAWSFATPLAFILLLLAAQPVRADIYKWIDESGVIHYSGTPPAKSSKTILKRLSSDDLSVPQAKAPKSEVHSSASEVQAIENLNSRATELKGQLDTEHQAGQATEAQKQATQAAYAQAIADQQSARNVSYFPAVSSVVLFPSNQGRTHSRPDNCVSMAGTSCSLQEQ